MGKLLQTVFYVTYPFIVYLGYQQLTTRHLGVLLLSLHLLALGLNARESNPQIATLIRIHLPMVALMLAAAATQNRTLLLLLPVLVSGSLFLTFAASLRFGPPLIERFARAVEGDLPDFTFSYCRRVTIVWTAFLGINTVVIVALATSASLELWAIYTGFIFYVLLAFIMVTEFLFRKWYFRLYNGGPLDGVLERVFPAEATPRGRRTLSYVARREGTNRDG